MLNSDCPWSRSLTKNKSDGLAAISFMKKKKLPTNPERDALKAKLSLGVRIIPALLPINNPEFNSCSHAIKRAANLHGAALPMPAALLPPM